MEDSIENWIIDPKMVARSALENAASAASMFLTTEVAITNSAKWIFDFDVPNPGDFWKNLWNWKTPWVIWV